MVVKQSLTKVLFETKEANLVEIFDEQDLLCAVLMRVADGDLWQVGLKGDPDFEQFARQNGYKTASIIHPHIFPANGKLAAQ